MGTKKSTPEGAFFLVLIVASRACGYDFVVVLAIA